MNKKIIKFGVIPIMIILVTFSYVTLADDPKLEQNALGIEMEEIPLIRGAQILAASEIEPTMENVIAFDISNGQLTSDYTGFIADLELMGYTVATINIDDGIPDNVVKLIVSAAGGGAMISEAYSTSEAILLEQWVNDGGELLVLAEWGSMFTDRTDEICAQFGVTQNADYVVDTDDYVTSNSWIIYEGDNLDSTHPILNDVISVQFQAGCTFDSTDGVIIRTDDDGTATPSDAPVAVAKEWGAGRVAIFGDYNWISDYGDDTYHLLDNSKLAINTILWLNDVLINPPIGATSVRLLAGQTIHVGDVYIWNDNDDVHVLYRTFDDWYLLETHFDIEPEERDIPQTKKGNPIPGHFEFSESFDITDYVTDWYISFPIPADMDYGDIVAAAAHAEVAHVSEGCIEVISDESTQSFGIPSGKPDSDSVYAWEHPAWSVPKSEFVLGAEWIWESEYVFDPEIDNWVFFTKDLEIPGLYPIEILGDIKITCDNEYYTLSVNWVTVGTDDNWQTVETYDISDKLDVGLNEIEIIAKNLGVEGSTTTTNPGGLIYESSICYEVVDQEESAWGEGIQFNPHPKRNWGMYFKYIINTPPVADIEPEGASIPWCDPITFFGDGSYDPDGDPITYFWDFGDGATSTDMNPMHIYTVIGTYTVTLTVTDDQGATDTTTTTIEVTNTPPLADFTYNQPFPEFCEPVYFYDASYDPDWCDSWTYYWDFGDGESSTDMNPVHTYSASGTYTVTLTVTDGYGDSDSISYDVTVTNNPPYADFDVSSNYLSHCNQPVYFYDQSTDPDWCDSLTYHWDFDDGDTSTEKDPSHIFDSIGIYNVELQVTDEAGAVSYFDMDIEIYNEEPYADFSVPDYLDWCFQPFVFDDYSYDNDFCDTLAYYWEFGDGDTSTDPEPTHSYASPGPYTVTLTVTDDGGESNSYSHGVSVYNSQPTASFSVDEWELYWCDQPFQFYEECDDYDYCQTLTYYWDFGDGATSTDPDPTHTYASPGTYWVDLTVTDPFGELNTHTDYVVVTNAIPHADPAVDETFKYWCDQPFDFHSAGYDPDYCGSLTYLWDFDDGQTSTQENPYHTYTSIGTYTVSLTVTDDFGASDTNTIGVEVGNTYPYAYFTWSPYNPYEYDTVYFSSSSYDNDPCDDIVSWYWEFGDGATSTEENPSHTYTTANTYTVSLEVTDGYGWTDYDEDYIDVLPE